MKFDFYADPGHGWLKVPRKLLCDLGIEDKITSYSYQRGEWAYLEEDQDASTFIHAMKGAGREYKFRERSTWSKQSKIRGYSPYRAQERG